MSVISSTHHGSEGYADLKHYAICQCGCNLTNVFTQTELKDFAYPSKSNEQIREEIYKRFRREFNSQTIDGTQTLTLGNPQKFVRMQFRHGKWHEEVFSEEQELQRKLLALEQSQRRRETWHATQKLARSSCALLINFVDCVKATATWLYWEARH